jgi:hypothetical protein
MCDPVGECSGTGRRIGRAQSTSLTKVANVAASSSQTVYRTMEC